MHALQRRASLYNVLHPDLCPLALAKPICAPGAAAMSLVVAEDTAPYGPVTMI